MKRRNRFVFLMVMLVLLPGLIQAQARSRLPLNGEWTFAMDPVETGEQERWFGPEFASAKFDRVVVPHCWSVDKRFEYYTGKAWYFKRFAFQGNNTMQGSNQLQAGMHQFLHFDAVFYKARIWLNGQPAGEHEGGYTPFEVEVTGKLKDENVLAVEVDNSWDTTTIPGAKTAVPYEPANAGQLYPWINYGGITRNVSLISRPDVYIRNIKITADPDLKKGTAQIRIVARLTNLSGTTVRTSVHARISRDGQLNKKLVKEIRADLQPGSLQTGSADSIILATQLSPNEVALWDQDHPHMYQAEVVLNSPTGSDTLAAAFGIRKLEIVGNKLLLNGEPIKMGGANRPMDHPDFGSMDPDAVLEKDLGLMKNGCMELSRINHYPVTEAMLNWADKNGMLFIEEAGNWQMTPKQMSDPLMRRKFESQMKEMVERDWNHPCIFAWSVGNEFPSQATEGKDWVKDMGRFTRGLDPSRFITFASMMVWRDMIKTRDDEASNYVDFISANMYGNYLKFLQHIHEVYPDKAVYVSEFGIRADGVKDENARIEHLQNAMAAFRECDYVIGANIWTFNDYRSRYPGTNANGYRPWGLITPQRETRGMYTAWQEEFAPAILEKISLQNGQLVVRVTARKDFPAYTLRDYSLSYNGKFLPLRTLRPGESQEVTISLSSTQAERQAATQAEGQTTITLVKPGGFEILKLQAGSFK